MMMLSIKHHNLTLDNNELGNYKQKYRERHGFVIIALFWHSLALFFVRLKTASLHKSYSVKKFFCYTILISLSEEGPSFLISLKTIDVNLFL